MPRVKRLHGEEAGSRLYNEGVNQHVPPELRSVAAAVLSMAAAVVTLAQSQQPPVFRARVDLVQVDVTVLDDRRRPVRGLKGADFVLLEDGRPQEIVAFTEMSASEPTAAADHWQRTVVPDVKVNNAEDGRLLLLILDDARTPVFPRAPDAAPPSGPSRRTPSNKPRARSSSAWARTTWRR